MRKHTPTPWRLKTSGNLGNAIEADSGKRYGELDDGFRVVASYQECCKSDKYLEQRANCAANGAFIVNAVNNHDAMLAELKRLFALFGHQATADVIARADPLSHRVPVTACDDVGKPND